jgi:hypothetical protein
MRRTRTTQSELSRLSGVRQPSISQFLSGTVDLSDDQLDRLLSCMGYRHWWESLVGHGDVLGLHRVLTGLDRDSIEMHEVPPMSGILPQDERQAVLLGMD